MTASLIQRALGSDFGSLHPASRERHGFGPESHLHSVGVGTMERVWHSSRLFDPFLRLGAVRNIMFPESGSDIPFRIECWTYRDSHDRETLSLNRTFEFEKPRRFDEYVVGRPDGSHAIYVGNHQHLVAEISIHVTERGGLEFLTGPQRLLTRGPSFRFPRLFSASARVEEWFDETDGRFHIDARVRNRILGDVLGCVGSFESRVMENPEGEVPTSVKPRREDVRSW